MTIRRRTALSLLTVCFFFSGLAAHGQERRRLPPGPVIVEPPSPAHVEAPYFTSAAGFGGKKGLIPIGGTEDAGLVVSPDLPGPKRLFQRDSEQQVFERIKIQARMRPGSPAVYFPEDLPVTREPFTGRNFLRSVAVVEPSYVCHGRLLFEQRNFERYGWDLGPITPVISVGRFGYDLVLLPYHCFTDPWRHYDCSAGKCLPGDPVPLRLYREKFSLTGLAAQGAAVGLAMWIFP